tara:strand:- start:1093 stop:2388 length:1296 start_codon:yes stop_codon:yes gene_type:complete
LSLKSEIEAIVGDIDSPDYTAEAVLYLKEGVKYITKYVMRNFEMVEKLTSSTTLNNSPTTMDTSNALKILSVTRNDGSRDRIALQIPSWKAGDYTDTNSIYYTSKLDPKWYISNATLNVIPTPAAGQSATVKHITPDTSISLSDTSLSNFPDELERGVVLYAAKEMLRKFMNVRNATLRGLTLADASVPSTINLSAVTYVDPAAGDASATAVSDVTVSSPPAKPDISGNQPAYSESSSSVDYAAGSTGVDDWITDEDPEMAQVALEKQAQLLQDYQLDIQNKLNTFNRNNAIYAANIEAELAKHNSDLQVAVTNAQIAAADAQQTAEQATQVSIANKQKDLQLSLENRAKDMEALIADNSSKVQDYMARVESYANQVNDNVQTYSLSLQEVSQDYAWYMEQYQIVLQDLLQFLQVYLPQPVGGQDEVTADD